MFFCVFPSMNTADCAGWGRNATWGRVGRVRIGETGNNMGGGGRKLSKYPLSHYTTSQNLKRALLQTAATSLACEVILD